MAPLLRAGLTFAAAVRLALAADTLSIAVMEIVDNAIMLAIPGAMAAPLTSALFWLSLGVALAVAGVVAFPVNRWLIRARQGPRRGHGPSRPPPSWGTWVEARRAPCETGREPARGPRHDPARRSLPARPAAPAAPHALDPRDGRREPAGRRRPDLADLRARGRRTSPNRSPRCPASSGSASTAPCAPPRRPRGLGIPCVALFPFTEAADKNPEATEAWNPEQPRQPRHPRDQGRGPRDRRDARRRARPLQLRRPRRARARRRDPQRREPGRAREDDARPGRGRRRHPRALGHDGRPRRR